MSLWGPVSNREAAAMIFLFLCVYVAIGVISLETQGAKITPASVAVWPLDDGSKS